MAVQKTQHLFQVWLLYGDKKMKAEINDYYMLSLPGYPKDIPYQVVEVCERFAVLENVLRPSEYGFSKPFLVSALPIELHTQMSKDMVIRWVERQECTLLTRKAAREGDKVSQRIIEQWEDYRDMLRG